jgi:curved DNA-binding protein CbpA
MAREARLSDSAGPASAGAGYFATLGLPFAASARDVARAFRTVALTTHPDKVGTAPEHLERFQAAATACRVLTGESSRTAYMSMYRIRCYIHQRAHKPDTALAPFYALRVRKKNAAGFEQPRLLTLDLVEGALYNWKEDALHKRISLTTLADVRPSGQTSLTLTFDGGQRPYRLSAYIYIDTYVSALGGFGCTM